MLTAPVDITVYILHRGKEVEQGDDGGGQVPHHDTQDEQYEVALHEPRQQEVEERDAHGTTKGTGYNRKAAWQRQGVGGNARTQRASQGKHDNGHAQRGSLRDAEYRRTGQGITEEGLEHETAHGQ